MLVLPTVNLGPGLAASLGSTIGGGLGKGILAGLEDALRKKEQQKLLEQQYRDFVSLAQALQPKTPLAESLISSVHPQTEYGLSLLEKAFVSALQPPEQPKIVKGQPFISEGRRKVPFYDEQGNLVRLLDLGKVDSGKRTKIIKGQPFVSNGYRMVPIYDSEGNLRRVINLGKVDVPPQQEINKIKATAMKHLVEGTASDEEKALLKTQDDDIDTAIKVLGLSPEFLSQSYQEKVKTLIDVTNAIKEAKKKREKRSGKPEYIMDPVKGLIPME